MNLLRQRHPILFFAGLVFLVAALLTLNLMAVDSRQLLGVSVWLKPTKFFVSVGIFCWTAGWLLGDLASTRPTWTRQAGNLIALSMLVEMICICIQAARGVPSHYNNTSALNGILFGIMGGFILLNSVIMVWMLKLFLTEKINLLPGYRAGIVSGLVIFLFGSLVGGVMVSLQAHTVGAPDGGPGLPLLNWARQGGDLRVAHFLGMHALQILPAFGWWMDQHSKAAKIATLRLAWVMAAVVIATFVEAMLKFPFY